MLVLRKHFAPSIWILFLIVCNSKIVELGGQDEFYFLMSMLHFNHYINTLASNVKITLHMKIMPDFYENRYPI